MSTCPPLECCPPPRFPTIGTVPLASDANCLRQECCDASLFSVVPSPITPVAVTCNYLNEFNVWLDGAPVLCSSGNEEFGLWFEGAPFVEKSDNY